MQNLLGNEIKREIEGLVNWVLEPVEVKVVNFGDSYEITHWSQRGNEPQIEWKEVMHTIELERDAKRFLDTISDLHLQKNVADAVWVMCYDFCYTKGNVTDTERKSILERLYSEKLFQAID